MQKNGTDRSVHGRPERCDRFRKAGTEWSVPLFCVVLLVPVAFSQPVFTAEANLQSIAVRVADRQGRDVRGLKADDFTLLEDGKPQTISFFGADEQPISLAVLVDSSASMRSGHKLEGVRELLPPLLKGNLPDDEIFFAQFTDRVFPLQRLSGDERAHPVIRQVDSRSGTAFYDALATTLCTLRGAKNLRQAVVVITDGADQHSRLSLAQLIQTAQGARPQIFTIGFFDEREADIFRSSEKTVTLVNSHEIDNPLKAFERISKETGAESFFPSNQKGLEKALDRILGILHAQYTLAYHTSRPDVFRKIEVKVKRSGVVVSSRRAVGAEESSDTAHFTADSCEVSAKEHPYPWEPHVMKTPDGVTTYLDNFSDPKSGWPNRPGLRYAQGSYWVASGDSIKKVGSTLYGSIAAYGPWFENFRASVVLGATSGEANGGLIFRLNERGYYMVLVRTHGIREYKLVKRFWGDHEEEVLVPWSKIMSVPKGTGTPESPSTTIGVECVGDRIGVLIDGAPFLGARDDAFADGQVGMAHFGAGHAVFRDLRAESVK